MMSSAMWGSIASKTLKVFSVSFLKLYYKVFWQNRLYKHSKIGFFSTIPSILWKLTRTEMVVACCLFLSSSSFVRIQLASCHHPTHLAVLSQTFPPLLTHPLPWNHDNNPFINLQLNYGFLESGIRMGDGRQSRREEVCADTHSGGGEQNPK